MSNEAIDKDAQIPPYIFLQILINQTNLPCIIHTLQTVFPIRFIFNKLI